MSVASEADPEGGEGSAWVAGVAATLTGPARLSTPKTQVAQAGHDVGSGAGSGLGAVLTEGDVAEVVQRLDGPVPAQQVGAAGRWRT